MLTSRVHCLPRVALEMALTKQTKNGECKQPNQSFSLRLKYKRYLLFGHPERSLLIHFGQSKRSGRIFFFFTCELFILFLLMWDQRPVYPSRDEFPSPHLPPFVLRVIGQ